MKKTGGNGKNPYQTSNPSGIIRAPKNTKADQPKADVIRGGDLRSGTKSK